MSDVIEIDVDVVETMDELVETDAQILDIDVIGNESVGGGGGVAGYGYLLDKPSINGVTLVGDKTTEELGIVSGVQSDWNQTDTDALDFIRNKPSVVSDVKVLNKMRNSDDAGYNTQVDSYGVARVSNLDFGFVGAPMTAIATPSPVQGRAFQVTYATGLRLADGGIISVKFPISVTGYAELQINVQDVVTTGYIPIYYNGAPLENGIIGANDTVQLAYDDSNKRWNLINVHTASITNSEIEALFNQ